MASEDLADIIHWTPIMEEWILELEYGVYGSVQMEGN